MAKSRVYSHEERTSEKLKAFFFLFLTVRTLFDHDCLHSTKNF